MFKHFYFFCFFVYSGFTLSQEQVPDSLSVKLPFEIDKSKKIPEEELEFKKEGTFITGLPRVEFDPIRGFGAGGNINLFVNKTKEDPFFDYTPYRHQLNGEFFIFQNGRIRLALNYDAPYFLNTKWRLRADAVIWEDPTAQYWGIGRSSLQPLKFRDKMSTSQELVTFDRVKAYEQNLATALPGEDGLLYTDLHYNHIEQREQLYNLLLERTYLGGRLRLMFGYEALFTSFDSYNGKFTEEAVDLMGNRVNGINNETLIDKQIAEGVWDRFNLAGFTNPGEYKFTSMLAAALIYDTRDYEPDPSNGLFLQYSHEYSPYWLGSDFSFNKFMVQGQYIKTIKRWRENKSRLTFAGMAAFGYIFGSRINFIEMWDLSSQAEAGGILVLGGGRSLRGFREARFLAPVVALTNLELRTRLYDFYFLNQYISMGLTAFFDMGSVWDRPADFNFRQWKGSPGIGGRLAWNQSTILRLDFAHSSEGSQVFFGFGHIF